MTYWFTEGQHYLGLLNYKTVKVSNFFFNIICFKPLLYWEKSSLLRRKKCCSNIRVTWRLIIICEPFLQALESSIQHKWLYSNPVHSTRPWSLHNLVCQPEKANSSRWTRLPCHVQDETVDINKRYAPTPLWRRLAKILAIYKCGAEQRDPATTTLCQARWAVGLQRIPGGLWDPPPFGPHPWQ